MAFADIFPVSLAAMCFLFSMAFFAGFVDSIAGGGGLISLPAALVAGLPPQIALGTGKFMAGVGTSGALMMYARKGLVVWRVAAVGIVFSLIGSVLGARVAEMVDSALLGKILLWLLPVGVLTIFLPKKAEKNTLRSGLLTPVLVALVSFCLGFYDGFFGPGTGTFLLLALHAIIGLGMVAASATAKAINLASNLGALCTFIMFDDVWYSVAIPMAAANMAGNILGSRLALKGGSRIVRRMLLVSLALLFASLVWRYYIQPHMGGLS